jgi:hypothetical protein
VLRDFVPADRLDEAVGDVLALAEVRAAGTTPAHRALADAEEERQRWLAVQAAARAMVARQSAE